MLKPAFIGAFAPFARAPAPADFEWRRGMTVLTGFGRAVARALAPKPCRPGVGRIVTELAAINDHTLADIGIHRSQIPGLAHAVAERPGTDPRAVES